MGVHIKNWSLADWKELLKWAKIGANNAMIGEFAEVEEIPPHGRLIDADAFKKYITVSFEEVAPELEGGYKWLAERITNDLLKDIDAAPTVIPASEEVDDGT